MHTKVLLENGWNSDQMITEGEATISLQTTLHAFRNQEKTKQRSTIGWHEQFEIIVRFYNSILILPTKHTLSPNFFRGGIGPK